MLNMIRADLYRAIHGKTAKICLLYAISWVVICAYVQWATLSWRESVSGTEIQINYWESFFIFYPVLLPIVIFCNYFTAVDFSYGTIKGYLTKGISRWNYCLSRLAVGWIFSAVCTTAAFVTGIICSKVFWGEFFDESLAIGQIAAYLISELICHLAFATLVVSVAFWIKNNAASMTVNILLLFFGCLALQKIGELLKLNFDLRLLGADVMVAMISLDTAPLWLVPAVLIFAGYFVVFGIISIMILRKRDID